MKKKTPILDYYWECVERMRKAEINFFGACHLGIDDDNVRVYGLCCRSKISTQIYASFGKIDMWAGDHGVLNPLRENMILLCAAFHGEL